jgi:hypothetical protein
MCYVLGKPESTDFTRFEGVFSSRRGNLMDIIIILKDNYVGKKACEF